MVSKHEKHLDEMEAIFKAYADKNRLKIIWLLASSVKKDVSVNEIAEFLDVSQPAASQHIKILKNIGILFSQKDGSHVYYKINFDRLKEIKGRMDILFKMAQDEDLQGEI